MQYRLLVRRTVRSIALRLIGSIGRAYSRDTMADRREILSMEYPHSEGRAESSVLRLSVDHSYRRNLRIPVRGVGTLHIVASAARSEQNHDVCSRPPGWLKKCELMSPVTTTTVGDTGDTKCQLFRDFIIFLVTFRCA